MSNDEKMIAVRIQGHVQGVGFRAFVQGEARKLGVRGWVRNRVNGDVEALFIGTMPAVDALIAASRRGPDYARVLNLAAYEPAAEVLTEATDTDFKLLPTL